MSYGCERGDIAKKNIIQCIKLRRNLSSGTRIVSLLYNKYVLYVILKDITKKNIIPIGIKLTRNLSSSTRIVSLLYVKHV